MVVETNPLTQTMQNLWQTVVAGPLLLAAAVLAPAAQAQAPASPYIGRTRAQMVDATGVQIAGDVRVANGEMQLGNGSTITAGTETVPITLTRGGELRLCATTSVHLSRDRSIEAADASGLMLGLDRGAIEARYPTSKYSDVLLTPDLRILISGPGEADVSIRVSQQGDTCIDNRGANAPYITVTSPLEGGLYRVQPGQHVSFQHGSLKEVVDTEKEPCGCPPAAPPISVATAGTGGAPTPAAAGHPVGGPSSTPADTTFPLAVSEGLTKPPLPPTEPVAAPGEVHAQVVVPLHYDGSLPAVGDGSLPAVGASAPAPDTSAPESAAPAVPRVPVVPPAPARTRTTPAVPVTQPITQPAAPAAAPASSAVATTEAPQPPRPVVSRFFRRVGRFFARVFGAEDQGSAQP